MAAVAVFVLLAFAGTALAALDAVGPINPDNGFPLWYRDRPARNPASLTLEPCLDTSGFCLFDPAVDLPNPAAALSFPDNFPEEIFWWSGDSTVAIRGGRRGLLVMGLEGAFGGGPVLAGDQVSFARIRLRIDTPVAGTYTVTHPYGVETFPDVPAGRRTINMTRDIGIGAPGNFTGALKGDIGPFLIWDPAVAPPAPAGYIGDPNIPHQVIGRRNNFFRIDGPAGSNLDGAGNDFVQTDLFTISGKLATRFGVTVDRATYTRDAAGSTFIEVFASSAPGQTIDVTSTGLAAPIPMVEDPASTTGDYYVHFGPLAITDDRPPAVTVTNRETAGGAETVVTSDVVDVVTVAAAQYLVTDAATGAGTLSVTAASSDLFTPPVGSVATPAFLSVRRPVLRPFPTITLDQFNVLQTIPGFTFPAPNLNIRSSKGGKYNEVLPVAGAATAP
jgi:hypothetical protein